jgi:hypothetical protein
VATAAVKRTRRPKVLGVPLPRSLKPGNLKPGNLDLKQLKDIDLKKVAKQIGKAAEKVESTSEDVRMASQQAKRMSKKLS